MRFPDGCRLYTAHAEFGRNDHREDAPHFTSFEIKIAHRKKIMPKTYPGILVMTPTVKHFNSEKAH